MTASRHSGERGRTGGRRERSEPQERRLPEQIPMYQSGRAVFAQRPRTANTGLLYDRGSNVWCLVERREDGAWLRSHWERATTGQHDFLAAIAKHGQAGQQDVNELLDGLHRRRQALWGLTGATEVPLRLTAPLVSGLGMSHALDVGFVWDRNLGVPYLPGSSVKGAVRAWAVQWRDEGLDVDALRILGDTESSGAGSVTFHALYPCEPPRLRVDVLNPHFSEYYRRPDRVVPGDWLSPVPVFFLTVAQGTRFVTAIQPRPGRAEDGDTGLVATWLREALSVLGAGAKTAIGYGLFRPSS